MMQKDNTNDNCFFYLLGDAFAAVDNAWYDNENPDPTVEGQHATVLDDHCVSNNVIPHTNCNRISHCCFILIYI